MLSTGWSEISDFYGMNEEKEGQLEVGGGYIFIILNEYLLGASHCVAT